MSSVAGTSVLSLMAALRGLAVKTSSIHGGCGLPGAPLRFCLGAGIIGLYGQLLADGPVLRLPGFLVFDCAASAGRFQVHLSAARQGSVGAQRTPARRLLTVSLSPQPVAMRRSSHISCRKLSLSFDGPWALRFPNCRAPRMALAPGGLLCENPERLAAGFCPCVCRCSSARPDLRT